MLKSMVRTTGIDHVVLHVADLERSKRFYIDVLGMTVKEEIPGQVFLLCGGQMIGLFPVSGGEPVQTGPEINHMALTVDSGTYEELKAHLEDHGVEVRARPGNHRCVYFRDPDGHRLQFVIPRGH